MKRIALLALALIAFAAPLASAEVKTHPTAKVSMDVPTGWKMGGKGDLMTLVDPKDELGFILAIIEATDIQKVANNLDAQLSKFATDIKWKAEKPSALKLNGMDAMANKGTAKFNGKDAEIAVLLVKTPSGKALLIFGAVEASKKDGHKAEIEAFLSSIKPAP